MATAIKDKSYNQDAMATAAARYAGEACFSTRHGILPSDNYSVVIFDNNPFSNPQLSRDACLKKLELRLAERGLRKTGQGCYPETGDDAGYTVALVFTTAERNADVNAIMNLWSQIVIEHVTE